jgi:hypothetical protein
MNTSQTMVRVFRTARDTTDRLNLLASPASTRSPDASKGALGTTSCSRDSLNRLSSHTRKGAQLVTREME